MCCKLCFVSCYIICQRLVTDLQLRILQQDIWKFYQNIQKCDYCCLLINYLSRGDEPSTTNTDKDCSRRTVPLQGSWKFFWLTSFQLTLLILWRFVIESSMAAKLSFQCSTSRNVVLNKVNNLWLFCDFRRHRRHYLVLDAVLVYQLYPVYVSTVVKMSSSVINAGKTTSQH